MSGALKNRKIKIALLILSVLILILFLFRRGGKEALIQVRQGDTFYSVAENLKKEGIIRSRLLITVLARITGRSRQLKEGTYRVSSRQNALQIVSMLTRGRITSRAFTVPEGFNAYQIGELLQQKGIVKKADFLSAVQDKEILSQFHINQSTAEGFLYPETYFIPYEYRSEDIVKLMIAGFFKKITPLVVNRIKARYGSLEKGVNLASLVEWEARVDFERPIIAGVFLNRLNGGHHLGSCATVLYAMKRHKERLLFKDLTIDSPYNTYIYQGLPPTPICSPSEKSILAVIYPAKEPYLYFVSMNNGRHYFSTTYQEHLQAYRKYILGENRQN